MELCYPRLDTYRRPYQPTRITNHTDPIPCTRHRRKSTSMLGNQELRILQYNVRKSSDVVLDSLFRNPRVLEYDVLAIQEPWRNPFIATTYHPLKTYFQLTYLDNAATRVCFYINKRIDPGTWSISHVSRDIISMTICSPNTGKQLHIVNVFNEVGTNTLATLADTLVTLDPNNDMIVLGDFNLHHPLWSTTHRRANEGPSAQPLLSIIEDAQLEPLTVPGTPTHRWKDGESTIDLTFATKEIASRMVHCRIDKRLDCDSDHLPIDLSTNWWWQPAAPARKRVWTKTNVTILRQTVIDRLPAIGESTRLTDGKSIDAFVSSIVEVLQAGVEASTPWSNLSPHSIAGSTKNAKNSAQKSSSSADGGSEHDKRTTTKPTDKRVTERADTSRRSFETPSDRG